MQNSKIKIQNLTQSFKIRKLIIWIILIFTTLHLIKDITQDILNIPTFLDYFGNIQEDLSRQAPIIAAIFYFFAYLSFIVEMIIIILGLRYTIKMDKMTFKIIMMLFCALITFFIICTLFDPSPFRSIKTI